MKDELPEESFINRKRPALEGIIEDLLGPTSQLDEMISTNPWLKMEIFDEDNENKKEQ